MTFAPAITIKGRAKFGETRVFDGLDLVITAGEWTCLLGSSGVGKSTVLKLLAGLAGNVDFEGDMQPDDMSLAGQVALMAQDDLLLPWLTALENTMLGARLRGQGSDKAKAMDVLDRVGLGDKFDQKPSALSGGQRQRVALARTLMEDRPVVLLDEPFSALDARTRAQMQELACEVLSGRTVLLVTHDPAEAARLGHQIKLMRPDGIEDFTPPAAQVPRAVDDPDVLAIQGKLLARLREGS